MIVLESPLHLIWWFCQQLKIEINVTLGIEIQWVSIVWCRKYHQSRPGQTNYNQHLQAHFEQKYYTDTPE